MKTTKLLSRFQDPLAAMVDAVYLREDGPNRFMPMSSPSDAYIAAFERTYQRRNRQLGANANSESEKLALRLKHGALP